MNVKAHPYDRLITLTNIGKEHHARIANRMTFIRLLIKATSHKLQATSRENVNMEMCGCADMQMKE